MQKLRKFCCILDDIVETTETFDKLFHGKQEKESIDKNNAVRVLALEDREKNNWKE